MPQSISCAAAAPPHPVFAASDDLVVPLPVVGELYAGAEISKHRERNLRAVDDLLAACEIITPDRETARIYGRVRLMFRTATGLAVVNDLWIAAICLQHELSLATNDRDFDRIEGLSVVRP
jgi:tRNA(fMet)-specific endonuclease VapC